MLSRRLSPEDVVQETFAAALMRADFFKREPEVPLYFKLRTILFQTMVDLERRHLAAQKRDAYKEVDNAECAQALGIEPKAASIRYVRALERLQKKLVQYTEFQN